MNPRKQLLSLVLKDLEKTLDKGVVTPEELIQAIEVLVDKITKVKGELESGIITSHQDSDSKNKNTLDRLTAIEARLTDIINGVKNDLFLDLTEARDRFEREVKSVQSSIPQSPDLSYLERGLEEVRNAIPQVPHQITDAHILSVAMEVVKDIPGALEKIEERIQEIANRPATGGMPTLRLHVNGEYIGNTRDLVLSGSGVSSTETNGMQTIVITSGSGGFTVETPSGAVDASNSTFTVTAAPQYVISDGITYFENKGYTRSGLTITMDIPPSQYLRAII